MFLQDLRACRLNSHFYEPFTLNPLRDKVFSEDIIINAGSREPENPLLNIYNACGNVVYMYCRCRSIWTLMVLDNAGWESVVT